MKVYEVLTNYRIIILLSSQLLHDNINAIIYHSAIL
jgi:hypothetical protein